MRDSASMCAIGSAMSSPGRANNSSSRAFSATRSMVSGMSCGTLVPGEIGAMTDQLRKILENRLCRVGERQGLRSETSQLRHRRAIGSGTLMLTDAATNSVAYAPDDQSGCGLSPSDIADQLRGGRDGR